MSLYEDFFLTMLVKTIRMCFRLKKVFFENSYGDKRLIGQSKDKEDAFRIIDNFLKDHNYKCYYKRTWQKDEYMIVDVGSWSEFFYIEL